LSLTTGDAPSTADYQAVVLPVFDGAGNEIGQMSYVATQAWLDATFSDWCAIIDPSNNITYPAFGGWYCKLDVPVAVRP